MSLQVRPVDRATVQKFLNWRYEPPYDIYDLDTEKADEAVDYFTDPKTNCCGITDETGNLVAFCTFGSDGQVPGGDYRGPALDIGLGVRPDLTGQGQGHLYVSAAVDFARRTFEPRTFRVTVAEFNKRALRVWEKAGFRQAARFKRVSDGLAFVILTKEL
jgi:ribosomal-protein-alanine N-acetyltransferase